MFRRKEHTLQPDAKYRADLEELGYFVDQNGCFRNVEAPEKFYWFHCTNHDRHNQVRGEAMRVCQRQEMLKRLAALGIKELYLPTLSSKKPDGPHIPILAPNADVLKTRKRVIVVINDDTYQDLGILAYRELQREGGVNGGTIVNFVKGLVSRTRANVDPDLEELLAKDGAGIENDEDVPGVIVLNNSQLLYSHKFNEALSIRAWSALPRKSIAHYPIAVHHVENHVEGHRTSEEHIKTVFDTIIKNPEFVSPEAEVYVVAIENGVEKLINVLEENCSAYATRITALAAMQSPVGGQAIHNKDVIDFLNTRARHWETSQDGSSSPTQCNALPPNYTSTATSHKPDNKASVDWLEVSRGNIGHRVDTPFANKTKGESDITPQSENLDDNGFLVTTPICPTFGGGDTWVGECIFTQPIVQQAVMGFFEEVARDPQGFRNPDFSSDMTKPSSDDPAALPASSNIPEEMLNREKQAVLAAQEELRALQIAFAVTPKDNPKLASSLLRLQKRIEKKNAEIKDLEEEALAAGALSAGAAKEVRKEWENKTNEEESAEKVPGKQIDFAGVKADSNLVAGAGCLNTVKEELAKLDLDEDKD